MGLLVPMRGPRKHIWVAGYTLFIPRAMFAASRYHMKGSWSIIGGLWYHYKRFLELYLGLLVSYERFLATYLGLLVPYDGFLVPYLGFWYHIRDS